MIRRFIFFCLGSIMTLGLGILALLLLWPDDPAQQAALAADLLDLDSFQAIVRSAVLDGLKSEYVSQHHWGQQTHETEGVRLRGSLLAPRVERREQEVNDGLWQRFVVDLVDPEQNISTRVESVVPSGDGQYTFTFHMQARVEGRGQFERWVKGVRLFDVSSKAAATVAARITCQVGMHREPGNLIDDVVLDPQVTAISLELIDLDLERVGQLGHDVSRELGAALKPTIAHELERREPHFVDKANASIAKHHDRLRFSLDRFLASGWSKLQTAVAGAATNEHG